MSAPDPRANGTARMIFLAVIAQLVLGLALVIPDLGPWLRQTVTPSPTLPTGPVSPGDQRRLFRPAQGPSGPPALPLPDSLPERLGFQLREHDGEQVLVVLGGITEGDADRFDRFLASATPRPTRVILHSPGGQVSEALRIGRTIRASGLDTGVLAGMGCFSACPYVFAGGADRQLSRDGALGVRQHYYDAPGYLPVFLAVEGIQQGQSETLAYLVDMGVDPRLMIPALRTPPEEIYVVLPDEATEWALATTITD